MSACVAPLPPAEQDSVGAHTALGYRAESTHERYSVPRMDVPVWDPSGEALVEVTDLKSGEITKYWMVFEDGQWLVAGYVS